MKYVESINNALFSLLESDSKVILYGEDIIDPYGGAFKVTKGLSTSFPERVFSTPISEAALVGIAGGMAIGGLKPIVEIMFGDFISLGIDQILNHLVKYEWMYNNKVCPSVTIRTAMGGRRGYGPTHSQSLESLLATVPKLNIFSPSIYHNPGKLLKDIVLSDLGISVFSENKISYPKTLVDSDNIKEGLSIKVSIQDGNTVYVSNMEFEPPEVIIITHGGNALMIEDILLDLLMEHELSVQANILSKIKPIESDEVFNGVSYCKCIITLEESPKSYGWGSEIVSQLAESGITDGKAVYRVGAKELPIPSSIELEAEVLPGKYEIINYLKSINII